MAGESPAGDRAATASTGRATDYQYYKNGQPKELSVFGINGLEITYEYDEAGNRTKITRGAQNYSTFAYDERDSLSGISHIVGGSTAASVSYTRDGVGSPTADGWKNGGADWMAGS